LCVTEVPLRAVTSTASGEPRYSLRSEESLLCNLDLISGRPRSRYDEKLVLPTPPLIEARLNMLSRYATHLWSMRLVVSWTQKWTVACLIPHNHIMELVSLTGDTVTEVYQRIM